jgi:hypothetical protein
MAPGVPPLTLCRRSSRWCACEFVCRRENCGVGAVDEEAEVDEDEDDGGVEDENDVVVGVDVAALPVEENEDEGW